MTTYSCWDLDCGHTEEDAEEIETVFDDDPEGAAEEYAEKRFDGGDAFESVHVAVRRHDETEAVTFKVIVEYDPVFHASPASVSK